jgi:hypothetical protein
MVATSESAARGRRYSANSPLRDFFSMKSIDPATIPAA